MIYVLTNKSKEISLLTGFQNGNTYIEVYLMYNDLSVEDKLKFDKFILLIEGSVGCTIDVDTNLSIELSVLNLVGPLSGEMYSITFDELSTTNKNIVTNFIGLIKK